jgi:large subunit ribosomal protein L6
MSRIGKKSVILTDKVKARLDGDTLFIEGPLGKHSLRVNPLVKVELGPLEVRVTRLNESREAREVHGMMRALIQRLVTGVTEGFKKVLDIEGIGYRAEVKGSELSMTLGFSHPVIFPIPGGIKIAVEKQTRLTLTGSDHALVGQTAAMIRHLRPPEPYKGKGIKYDSEVITRKVGKAAATASASK